MNVLSALVLNVNSLKILVLRLISYDMHRQPESADKLFFSTSTYHINYSYYMCNIILAQ